MNTLKRIRNSTRYVVALLVASGVVAGGALALAAEVERPTLGAASPASVRVEITPEGFKPSNVSVGAERRIVFRRTTESTCATSVAFPALGINKPLPLNTDVTIDLPSSAHGEVGFQCGVGMYKGKIVAQ